MIRKSARMLAIAIAATIAIVSANGAHAADPTPFDPPPAHTKNCKPEEPCILVCVKNTVGRKGNWKWIRESDWDELLAKEPQSYKWDSTLVHMKCAPFNSFLKIDGGPSTGTSK